jgi:hypothetical protein
MIKASIIKENKMVNIQSKYRIQGQNNPPLGWHIFVNQAWKPLCNIHFSSESRIYPGDFGLDFDKYQPPVCPDCILIFDIEKTENE